MDDALITRRLIGEQSPLIVELLIVPRGESGFLDSVDVSVASIVSALESSTLGDLVFAKVTGDAGLSELGLSLESEGGQATANDFRQAIEREYVPLPNSPQLSTYAPIVLLGTAAGLSVSTNSGHIGLIVEEPRYLLYLSAYLLGSPVRALAIDVFDVVRQHVAAAADRLLGRRDGVYVHPANARVAAAQQPPRPLGRVRVASGTGGLGGASGTYGQLDGLTLSLRVLVTNDSDSGLTLMQPSLLLGNGDRGAFEAFQMGAGRNRESKPTYDLGARMAAEVFMLFRLHEAYGHKTEISGELQINTSHSAVVADAFNFTMTL